jgi:hypothetical protein
VYEPLDPGHAQLNIPQGLRDELGRLNPTPASDPAVDAAIMWKARSHLDRLQRRWLATRRWSLAGLAAAAAMLALFVVLPSNWRQNGATAWVREDINHDGRVDILDALALARRIEAHAANTAFDLTGDQVTDRRDVDVVALAVVRLDQRDVR